MKKQTRVKNTHDVWKNEGEEFAQDSHKIHKINVGLTSFKAFCLLALSFGQKFRTEICKSCKEINMERNYDYKRANHFSE